jgi:brefeldin A-inhibited guanine nucleotide-exchange protein
VREKSEYIVEHISQSNIDLIFSRSIHLDDQAIIEFISKLVDISRVELNDPENPRVFSLQKLVEVADFNMERVRFVWSRIWRHLGEHFSTVGSHPNRNMAEYSIDSLRQLAYKFLLKEELVNY